MRKFIGNRKGQNTAEYAILIGLVIAAAIAMQTYVKRGLQGKVKKAVDNVSAGSQGTTVQYEPYYTQSNFETVTRQHAIQEKTVDGGGFEKYMGEGGGHERTSSRTGYQKMRAPADAQ